jgi:hypothetical protein
MRLGHRHLCVDGNHVGMVGGLKPPIFEIRNDIAGILVDRGVSQTHIDCGNKGYRKRSHKAQCRKRFECPIIAEIKGLFIPAGGGGERANVPPPPNHNER